MLFLVTMVWVSHSKTLNNSINRLHKRALNFVHNDFLSRFSELLEKEKSVIIHHHTLQTLACKIFKIKNNMAPEIFTETFPSRKVVIILGSLQMRSIKTVIYGSETTSRLGLKIWEVLPTEFKNIGTLHYSNRKLVNGHKSSFYNM